VGAVAIPAVANHLVEDLAGPFGIVRDRGLRFIEPTIQTTPRLGQRGASGIEAASCLDASGIEKEHTAEDVGRLTASPRIEETCRFGEHAVDAAFRGALQDDSQPPLVASIMGKASGGFKVKARY
jgi:hypothetical protein